jgi:hypothetical protein
MPTLATWGDVVQTSFESLWAGFAVMFPRLLGAVIVFLIGLLLAAVLKNVIVRVSGWLRLDMLSDKLELKSSFEKAGIRLRVDQLLGWIVRWFVIVAALIAAADILEWPQVTLFLREVVVYLPNVFIAVVVLLAGMLLANFVRDIVHKAVVAAKLESADFLSGIARWAIFIFALMAALVQLQIAEELIRMLFAGFVAMLALSMGLAFGLGGKDHAHRFLERLRKDISSH